VDRWIVVSDRDAFLTTRRLAHREGILVGGSGGMAVHAALEVSAQIRDPEALVLVILPDGGRAYLSKIFSDGWMRQYGFVEPAGALTVGDVLTHKRIAGATPTLVTVAADHPVRDAVALLHAHQVSQLPVVDADDHSEVIGSVGERGLLRHAAADPGLLDEPVSAVLEPPFPTVAIDALARDAAELLVGDKQALLVVRDGAPEGLVTRTDLLEALVS
jgi:cystathionine beta-synthase